MALDLDSLLKGMDPGERFSVLPAIKILVEHRVFTRMAHANMNQLVENRLDFEDEAAVVKEIRETRQTNRILLGLEESAKQYLEGMKDE